MCNSWATKGKAQVALVNPGGLRVRLKSTASANTLVTKTLTGVQFTQVRVE